MTDRELLELIAAQVGKLTTDVDFLKAESRKTNMAIEHDVQPKLVALYDGQKQLDEKLERIEEKVSKHEELILKRVK
ncbi:MAG: hypothetical protein GX783_01455 [Clostridiales bacterium]|nr:hypothetical protein [Clostridiales bacterium]